METDPLASALGQWADGLAPAARDQLSTYDLRALYDRLARKGTDDGGLQAFDKWHQELGPATQAALSRYDRAALAQVLASGRRSFAMSPTAVGPSNRPGACVACGSRALVRTGTCLTCQDCGTTTGCS
ncbi:MAG: hypothetical protein AAGA48_30365 [Myxococcota bacterium]